MTIANESRAFSRQPSNSLLICAVLSACASTPPPTDIAVHPELWPQAARDAAVLPAFDAEIAALLERMTLEEKVGQIIQADIGSVTPEEVREFNLGSILNGGNSAPGGENRTSADQWLALADAFWEASTDTSDGGVGIPTIWGTDAVHGHSNVVGATLFPHNIGLGAARNPALLYDIGRVTAREILVTGLDWTFAPTIAVARDDRWGRTYESYSESPEIVAEYAPAIIEGLQGKAGTDDFLGAEQLIATAKHFLGDGGTTGGIDQGDNLSSEADLRDIHAAGYPAAIQVGVQAVMASYNSWHGKKLHGHRGLLTDVLVGQMGFDGFVVGDWNGHGQVKGCSNTSCPQAVNAGLDLFMAPDSWRGLYASTLRDVKRGLIPMTRLDEAVARVLRVKFRAGLMNAGRPSSRPLAGRFELLGSAAHREVARRAVRESLVLLKNNNGALPIAGSSRVLVTGPGADDIGMQTGGWTLSWQGTGNTNAHFPNAQSIFAGIREAVESLGGTAEHSASGSFAVRPDVAVVVFGEAPYAEFQGDREHLDFSDDAGLELLTRLQAEGIPTVSVFLSGRPLWVNPELNASDAFVAAWLPGSEGGGIADVLIGDIDGRARHDFKGKLSFSWPKSPEGEPLNVGDVAYDPLFAYGYGLTYAEQFTIGRLDDSASTPLRRANANAEIGFGAGVIQSPWRLTQTSNVTVSRRDRFAQEDSLHAVWSARGTLALEGPPQDFTRQTNADMALEIVYQVHEPPAGKVELQFDCGEQCEGGLDITNAIQAATKARWLVSRTSLSCFATRGTDVGAVTRLLGITSTADLELSIHSVRIVQNPGDANCEFEVVSE